MKGIMMFFLALGFAQTSQAARISCAGDYMGYKFSIRAVTSGTRLRSGITIAVIGPDGKRMGGEVPTISSDIRPHRYLHFAGRNATTGGKIEANYDDSSGLYVGTLDAHSPQGSAQIPVTCRLTGPRSGRI